MITKKLDQPHLHYYFFVSNAEIYESNVINEVVENFYISQVASFYDASQYYRETVPIQ